MVAIHVPSSKGRTSDFDSESAGSNPAGAAIIYALNSVVQSTRLIRGRSAVRICECVPIRSPRLKGRTPDSQSGNAGFKSRGDHQYVWVVA